jgi:hypothetical protein
VIIIHIGRGLSGCEAFHYYPNQSFGRWEGLGGKISFHENRCT